MNIAIPRTLWFVGACNADLMRCEGDLDISERESGQRMLFVVPCSARSIGHGGNKIGEGRRIGEGGSDSEIEAMQMERERGEMLEIGSEMQH